MKYYILFHKLFYQLRLVLIVINGNDKYALTCNKDLYSHFYFQIQRDIPEDNFVPPPEWRYGFYGGGDGRGYEDPDSGSDGDTHNSQSAPPDMKTYLRDLELTTGATKADINKSHHRLAKVYHSGNYNIGVLYEM